MSGLPDAPRGNDQQSLRSPSRGSRSESQGPSVFEASPMPSPLTAPAAPDPSSEALVDAEAIPALTTRTSRSSDRERTPSIRLRRNSSSSSQIHIIAGEGVEMPSRGRSRPRSVSQPIPAALPPPNANAARGRGMGRERGAHALPRLTEEGSRPTMEEMGLSESRRTTSLPESVRERPASSGEGGRLTRRRRLSNLLWPGGARQRGTEETAGSREQEYHDDLVDLLDVIDPEIQTLSTLTNVQNSLFVPDLGSWLNRRPVYSLSQHVPESGPPAPPSSSPAEERPLDKIPTGVAEGPAEDKKEEMPALRRSDTITSRLNESHYAALPHGMRLEGWTEEEKWELDDHVRHMLHSRRSRFKRTMRGFGQYVRRPLGFLVTLYAVLITLFGLAWVLFLIGWIYVGDHQVYAIHIIDSVLVALFAVMGDGLAPFRAVDTYHMLFVVHYTRKSRRLKRNKAETEPVDALVGASKANDSVERIVASTAGADLESARTEVEQPLTAAQVKKMRHHQKKLSKSHSFYKPHETFTHNPFPLSFLIAIVLLLDFHSCLQISLGATTWGIDYHHRNAAITTTILCVSITANLSAGLLISMGDKRTRKREVVELLERQELTGDAIRHLQGKRARRGGGLIQTV